MSPEDKAEPGFLSCGSEDLRKIKENIFRVHANVRTEGCPKVNNFFVLTFALFAVLAVLYGVFFLWSCYRLVRLPFMRSVPSFFACEEIPGDIRARLETARPFLESLGFTQWRCLMAPPETELAEAANVYALEFRHAETGASATVTPHSLPSFACHIKYTTFFRNGETWSTVNGLKHLMAPSAEKEWIYFDDCLPDERAVWDAHRLRVEASGKMVLMDEHEATERLFRCAGRLIENRVEQGIFRPGARPERWHMTWPAAIRWMWRAVAGRRKARRIRLPAAKDRFWQKQAETEHSRQLGEFYRVTALKKRGRLVLFFLSAILFVAAGQVMFGSGMVWPLLGVLALHEGGHWLAMKLTGHTDVSVFFIPGLGALTTGKKVNSTPMQRLLISLAGPLPGLAAGLMMWGLMTASPPYLKPSYGMLLTVYLLVAINYLNLLPLFPLDGGHIVELLLFSRHPRLRMGFEICSVLTMFGVADLAGSYPAWILAFLVAMLLPSRWYLMQGSLAFGASGVLTEDEARERAFDVLQAPDFEKWNTNRRRNIAEFLVMEAARPRPKAAGVVFGVLLYGFCLWLPYLWIMRVPFFAQLFR